MKPLRRHFVRSLEGQTLLEIFFVTAVVSVLAIRFFLALTGYPRLSPGSLHIAHVLLGGLFMMLALFVSLGYVNKSAQYAAAVMGGFGFGAFIDELGKFITMDNNYFYRPTAALIYITFILLYLGIKEIIQRPLSTSREKLVNALELAKEVILEDLDHQERRKALDLLKECSASDPVTKALRTLLYSTESIPAPGLDIYTRTKIKCRRFYRTLAKKSWFVKAAIAFFLLQSIMALVLDIFMLYIKLLWGQNLHEVFPTLTVSDQIGLVSATLSAAIAIVAIMTFRNDRLKGYLLFKNAVLVQILLVQVFVFYRAQFLAFLGLVGNLCVLLVLNYMIMQEREEQHTLAAEPNHCGTN
ncbi:MAG: hypothetical protein EHM14_15430 [Methanothrix sp.]|nr:MAG: hypothetical protein EHM14_15430 [Methanothrix sp.]